MSRSQKSNPNVLIDVNTLNGNDVHENQADVQADDQADVTQTKPPTRELLQAARRKIPTVERVSSNGETVRDQADDQAGIQATTADRTSPKGDMFDNLDALRCDQNFAADSGVKKILSTIPVCKPARDWFCRVHPDPAYRLTTTVLDLEREKEKKVYIIAPSIRSQTGLDPLLANRLLVTAITRDNDLFLWLVKLSRDGKENRWNSSAMDAVNMAKTTWVRVSSSDTLGCYEMSVAVGQIPDPVFPDLPFAEILRIAFKDTIIDTLDHPVLKRLRGEV